LGPFFAFTVGGLEAGETMKRSMIVIISIVTSLLCSCGGQVTFDSLPQKQPISAGTKDVDDPATGFPNVGMLILSKNSACSGTLIGSRTVLTAGHCVVVDDEVPMTFVVGANARGDGDGDDLERYGTRPKSLAHREYGVQGWIPYPGYDDHSLYRTGDLGVVFLFEPVVGIKPAQLAKPEDVALMKGDPVTLVGYGCITADPQSDSWGYRYKGYNTVDSICLVPDGYETFVMTSAGGSSGCPGDSGGAVFRTLPNGSVQQVGVLTKGGGDLSVTVAELVAYSANYNWIKSVAKQNLGQEATANTILCQADDYQAVRYFAKAALSGKILEYVDLVPTSNEFDLTYDAGEATPWWRGQRAEDTLTGSVYVFYTRLFDEKGKTGGDYGNIRITAGWKPGWAYPGGLEGELLRTGNANQTMPLNFGAALQKYIMALDPVFHAYRPNSPEFALRHATYLFDDQDQTSLAVQRAENLREWDPLAGDVRVFWVSPANADNPNKIRFAIRPSGKLRCPPTP
jgi:hypothetical protein